MMRKLLSLTFLCILVLGSAQQINACSTCIDHLNENSNELSVGGSLGYAGLAAFTGWKAFKKACTADTSAQSVATAATLGTITAILGTKAAQRKTIKYPAAYIAPVGEMALASSLAVLAYHLINNPSLIPDSFFANHGLDKNIAHYVLAALSLIAAEIIGVHGLIGLGENIKANK